MKKYLLDTNICVYFLNGKYNLESKIDEVGFENCVISEITIAELKYGVEKSTHKENNRRILEIFQTKFNVIPIFPSLDIYAKEKARLKTIGKILDDFDMLIGTTAIFNNLILVTKNVSDFDRLHEIKIEDWTLLDLKTTKNF
jgi:tRNA(fMet)-specific endonuclease VapC